MSRDEDRQREMEKTRPEPDREAEAPAEQHRSEGTPRRGITRDQQRDELHGGAAQRREKRNDADRDTGR